MLLKTTEIRWFWSVTDNDETCAWFNELTLDVPPEKRTDRYLILLECATVGIKLRADRFEVKLLLDETAAGELPARLTGRVQQWLKWSVENLASNGLAEKSDRWISINKLRYQRHFNLQQRKVLEIEAEKQTLGAGCRVELTLVSLPDRRSVWIGLGFEADDGVTDPVGTMRSVLKDFFRRRKPPPVGLTAADSLSYPAWLAKLKC